MRERLASLARRAEIYTAKLASRECRAALAADIAGRQMFAQDPGNSTTAALIKEFGVHPSAAMFALCRGRFESVFRRRDSRGHAPWDRGIRVLLS